ncbi:unnamed protein product [Protopolystoma xenopodis]|uniref:Uncharacterized protein n=1 Tax=Protopolystoma xenopodis TaxID=117903 RepID=A0A448XCA4_9PLAT|nr:unnamed protein product [Protopolystoma xenopodis]
MPFKHDSGQPDEFLGSYRAAPLNQAVGQMSVSIESKASFLPYPPFFNRPGVGLGTINSAPSPDMTNLSKLHPQVAPRSLSSPLVPHPLHLISHLTHRGTGAEHHIIRSSILRLITRLHLLREEARYRSREQRIDRHARPAGSIELCYTSA